MDISLFDHIQNLFTTSFIPSTKLFVEEIESVEKSFNVEVGCLVEKVAFRMYVVSLLTRRQCHFLSDFLVTQGVTSTIYF